LSGESKIEFLSLFHLFSPSTGNLLVSVTSRHMLGVEKEIGNDWRNMTTGEKTNPFGHAE
jgi:hypothetical protein